MKGAFSVAVREDFRDGDKKLVCQTMNQLIRWIGELNWGDAELPAFELWEEEDVDTAQAERDEKLSAAMEKSGLKLSKSYYLRAYNLEDGDVEPAGAEPAPPGPGSEFAEGTGAAGQAAIDAFISSFSADDLQAEMKTVLMPLITDLQQTGDYAEAMEKLAEAYPAMNTDSLQEVLTRALFVAELAGRLDAGA